MRTSRVAHRLLAVAMGVALLSASQIGAAEFLRGDSNGDRAVTISDSHFSSAWLFLGRREPECMASADTNTDRQADLSDVIYSLQYLFLGGPAVSAPFPEIGPDPNPTVPCASYGNGSPLVDPAAKLEILSAVAHGGESRLAVVTLGYSTTGPIAGYHGRFRDEGTVFADARISQRGGLRVLSSFDFLAGPDDPCETRAPDFLSGEIRQGQVNFGLLASFVCPTQIKPGDRRPLAELLLCLKPGTKAGEYPLTFEYGELVATCFSENVGACDDAGRAIYPQLVGGSLIVEQDVTGTLCDTAVPPPPPPITIFFKLNDTTGAPGETVTMPFVIKADRASQGFSYSIDFDEGLLEGLATRKLYQRPDGTPYEFERFEINNQNAAPGNADIDEGFLVGAAVISLTDTDAVLSPSEEVQVLEFDLRIRANAEVGSSTEIAFRDGAQQSGGPVLNKLIAEGREITPGLASSFVFVNARLNIVADVISFFRGDSNGDDAVDLSDPIHTLAYMYQGERAPRCLDAADSNDDGKLDIADPVYLLDYLFKGGSAIPAPFAKKGIDPTTDLLRCGASDD